MEKSRKKPRRVAAYELLEKIGSGGMSTVYKARDIRTDAIIAVKKVASKAVAEEARGLAGRAFRPGNTQDLQLAQPPGSGQGARSRTTRGRPFW